jgi:hypothetical protein
MNYTGFLHTFHQPMTQIFVLLSLIWSGLIVLQKMIHGYGIHWVNLLWFAASLVGFLVSIGVVGK